MWGFKNKDDDKDKTDDNGNDDKDMLKDIKKMINGKNFANLIIIFLVGIMFAIVGNFFKDTASSPSVAGNNKNDNSNSNSKEVLKSKTNEKDTSTEEDLMENKLKLTLEKIEGVGNVQVMIYCDGTEEQVPAVNINKSTAVTDETDNSGGKRNTTQNTDGNTVVVTNDGQKTEPFILKKYKPKITGVCIVAEGADVNLIRLNITKAVIDLFGLPENKVNVYAMKK